MLENQWETFLICESASRVYSWTELGNLFNPKPKDPVFLKDDHQTESTHGLTLNITIIVTLLEFALIDVRFRFKFACQHWNSL